MGATSSSRSLRTSARCICLCFRKHHVRMTIGGHDHLLDHFVERYDDERRTYRMDHIVSGGGGAPTYTYRGEPDLQAYLTGQRRTERADRTPSQARTASRRQPPPLSRRSRRRRAAVPRGHRHGIGPYTPYGRSAGGTQLKTRSNFTSRVLDRAAHPARPCGDACETWQPSRGRPVLDEPWETS